MKQVKINKRKLMKEAWKQATFGQKMYGGNKKLYFASSLKLVWLSNQGKTISFDEVRRLDKIAKIQAMEIIKEEYAKYDAIWTERIKITQALYDHGEETVKDIARIMPNLLTYKETCSPIDEMADMYGFKNTSELVEYLLAYTPRTKAISKYHYEFFIQSITGLCQNLQSEFDECPF